MSVQRFLFILMLGSFCLPVLSNPLATMETGSSVIRHSEDISDTDFCRKIRFDREGVLRDEPNLIHPDNTPDYNRSSTRCFSPKENLYFIASQEAQKILGPHASWYLEISKEFRDRVNDYCKSKGFKNEDHNRAYDHCSTSRYEELIGPYQDKYRREAGDYIRKRKDIAEKLMTSCHDALSIKRNQLPKELRFPIAYYNLKQNSFPNWFVESKLDDLHWLESMEQTKADVLMHDVLNKECPGDMVYWVTYKKPGL